MAEVKLVTVQVIKLLFKQKLSKVRQGHMCTTVYC
jgi:hypothetical protein